MFDVLSTHLPADAVVTVDVGNHAYSLGRYLESKGQPVLMSGYLGSIGFGYPAALGAWAADYPVWHTSLRNPDWAAYAELCGATGIRVTTREDLDDAMTELFATTGPALLCIEQDAELL